MKKLFLSLIMVYFAILSANAQVQTIPYKNIKEKTKITYDIQKDNWKITNKKAENFYTKLSYDDDFAYFDKDNDIVFKTNSSYEFLYNGKLIGYNSSDLNFYDYVLIDDILERHILSSDEVQDIFPNYCVVKLSEFSSNTNSLKIKKKTKRMKLIVYNDIGKIFYNPTFSSNNANIDLYELNSFVDIKTKGMIMFSSSFNDQERYIILVR